MMISPRFDLARALALAWAVMASPLSVPAQAAPPVLQIDSGPLAASCKQGVASAANGATLLRTTAPAPAVPGLPSPPASPLAGELYQATLNPADWSGHFMRYALWPTAGGSGLTSTLAWDAGAILTGAPGRPPAPTPEQRSIYTAIVQPNGALAMTPFTWRTLSVQQQALLNRDDMLGEQRTAYLRGDRALEGKPFRRRGSVLGDAVHSTPVYVGGARAAIYLGANDGMLHAFDAASGTELFAYIPDALVAHLPHLTDPGYAHRAYVDGPAGTYEIRLGGSKRTLLVSAMGSGAQGVFALDVTDPTRFADGLGVLWEFTDRDDPLMGNVTTVPQIAAVRTGAGAYRHFAVVASGLNNYADDGRAGDGKGALFLLALDKPREEGWQLNSNYYRITTPLSDDTLANGLSAPVLLNDRDGVLRYAYAGDLQGNLWRFDFRGDAPWPDITDQPLFAARDAHGRRQPITQQPLLAFASMPGYMVLFGTGRMIEKADRSTASAVTQSYYAVNDNMQTPLDAIKGRQQLTPRLLDGSGEVLAISGARMDADSRGWYVDFVQAGERSVDSGVLVDGAVLFNTMLPGASACQPTRGRSYALSVLSGLADDEKFFAILPNNEAIVGLLLPDYAPSPVLMPQSSTRELGNAPGRFKVEKNYTIMNVTGQGKVGVMGRMKSKLRAGRLSWREVANWRELHEAVK